MRVRALLAWTVAGCAGEGAWTLQLDATSLRDGLPASAFEDGCSVRFSQAIVVVQGVVLRDEVGEPVGRVPGAQVFDALAAPEAVVGTAAGVAAGTYDAFGARIATNPVLTAAAGSEAALAALGETPTSWWIQASVSCPDGEIDVDWRSAADASVSCAAEPVRVGPDADASSRLTLQAGRLFVATLQDVVGPLRASWLLDPELDDDDDGVVRGTELSERAVPAGLDVSPHPAQPTEEDDAGGGRQGGFAPIDSAWAFVQERGRRLATADGSGACAVPRL